MESLLGMPIPKKRLTQWSYVWVRGGKIFPKKFKSIPPISMTHGDNLAFFYLLEIGIRYCELVGDVESCFQRNITLTAFHINSVLSLWICLFSFLSLFPFFPKSKKKELDVLMFIETWSTQDFHPLTPVGHNRSFLNRGKWRGGVSIYVKKSALNERQWTCLKMLPHIMKSLHFLDRQMHSQIFVVCLLQRLLKSSCIAWKFS